MTYLNRYEIVKVQDFPFPTDTIAAISGLDIQEGYICDSPTCRVIRLDIKNMLQHCRTHNNPTKYRATNVQRLQGNTKSPYFEVLRGMNTFSSGIYILYADQELDTSTNGDISNDNEIVEALLNEHLIKEAATQATEIRDISTARIEAASPWIVFTGWTKHLQDISLVDLTKLSKMPNYRYGTYPPYERNLNEALNRAFVKLYSSIDGISRSTLAWAASPSASQPATRPLQHPQTVTTWDRYTIVWRRCILYICRVLAADHDISADTTARCRRLIDHCLAKGEDAHLRTWMLKVYKEIRKNEPDIDKISLLCIRLMVAMIRQT